MTEPENNNKNNQSIQFPLKVMMIGPGSGIIGGISTLVDTILPAINCRVKLYYFPTVSNRPLKNSGIFSWENVKIAWDQFHRFVLAVIRFRPQLVHLHTSQGLAWLKDTFYLIGAKFSRARVIVHFHAADFDELYSNHTILMKFYTRLMLRWADAVITVSDLWRVKMEKIINPEKIFSFRNCIRIENNYEPGIIKKDVAHVNILFLGSVGPRKGAFELIEAMEKVSKVTPNAHLWLAGYEERPGDLELAAQKISRVNVGEHCELVGVITGEKKREFLQQMDIFALPSHNEGLPMAILEAMSVGKPVISCPVGGISEIVREGENGFLINPGDVDALADRIMLLVQDERLRQRYGQRSREIVDKELNVDVYAKRLAALYKDVMAKDAPANEVVP